MKVQVYIDCWQPALCCLFQWFEEKQQQVEALDVQLRKLHSSIEALVTYRKGDGNVIVK